jgi:hypothetical protein
MKLGIRTALLTTLLVASPVLSFAAGQGRIYKTPQDFSDTTKAVQYGKGTNMTRNEPTLNGNRYRSQTAQDKGSVKNNSNESRVNWSDAAYRK